MPTNTAPATLHLHIAARETVAELRVPGVEGQRFVLPIGCDTLWTAPDHGGDRAFGGAVPARCAAPFGDGRGARFGDDFGL